MLLLLSDPIHLPRYGHSCQLVGNCTGERQLEIVSILLLLLYCSWDRDGSSTNVHVARERLWGRSSSGKDAARSCPTLMLRSRVGTGKALRLCKLNLVAQQAILTTPLFTLIQSIPSLLRLPGHSSYNDRHISIKK